MISKNKKVSVSKRIAQITSEIEPLRRANVKLYETRKDILKKLTNHFAKRNQRFTTEEEFGKLMADFTMFKAKELHDQGRLAEVYGEKIQNDFTSYKDDVVKMQHEYETKNATELAILAASGQVDAGAQTGSEGGEPEMLSPVDQAQAQASATAESVSEQPEIHGVIDEAIIENVRQEPEFPQPDSKGFIWPEDIAIWRKNMAEYKKAATPVKETIVKKKITEKQLKYAVQQGVAAYKGVTGTNEVPSVVTEGIEAQLRLQYDVVEDTMMNRAKIFWAENGEKTITYGVGVVMIVPAAYYSGLMIGTWIAGLGLGSIASIALAVVLGGLAGAAIGFAGYYAAKAVVWAGKKAWSGVKGAWGWLKSKFSSKKDGQSAGVTNAPAANEAVFPIPAAA